jgi:gamma-glutamyl phosphate reductase
LRRPSACNSLECLLVHAADAARLLPVVTAPLLAEGVELRGDARTCELVPGAKPATDADWGKEYLAKTLAIRVVSDFEAALAHVARYGLEPHRRRSARTITLTRALGARGRRELRARQRLDALQRRR